MTDPINIAVEAFINAVVASMKTQAELVPLNQRLHEEVQRIESANERVLRSRGITDESPLDDALEDQSRYLDEAIRRTGFGEDHPVVKALRSQLAELEEAYRVMSAQMNGSGPEL